MTNSVHSIIGFKRKSYRNKVSIYVFLVASEKSDEIFRKWQKFLPTNFFAEEVFTDKVCKFPSPFTKILSNSSIKKRCLYSELIYI